MCQVVPTADKVAAVVAAPKAAVPVLQQAKSIAQSDHAICCTLLVSGGLLGIVAHGLTVPCTRLAMSNASCPGHLRLRPMSEGSRPMLSLRAEAHAGAVTLPPMVAKPIVGTAVPQQPCTTRSVGNAQVSWRAHESMWHVSYVIIILVGRMHV